MQPVLTPEEMAEADRSTIAAGTPVGVLMDRAGHAVAAHVRRTRTRIGNPGFRVVVVCGKGNNGGDGRIAAAAMRAWGAHVEVLELAAGIDTSALHRSLQRCDVVVDAMYGTGFRGTLEGEARKVVDALGDHPPWVVALDIPSGVDGLTGVVEGDAVAAHETVCLAALKPGLLFEPGRSHAGEVTVADIGIDVGAPRLGLVTAADVAGAMHPRPADTNKWKAGLLVVGGSGGMTGAPMLVSRAAMRAGAGIVWCAVPGRDAAAAASGSEIITKALPASDDGALADLGDLLDSIERFHALAVGPGLGSAEQTRAAVRELAAKASRPMVLDADGLNAFAGDPAALRQRVAPTVLTPHDGEYARLMGEPVGTDRVAAARALAQASGCVTLLKGSTTTVATPDGAVGLNTTGGPALATAGSGDVLTGIIGGLLANGVEPFVAATAAAYVHGRSADVAGHTGLVAGDLVAALPRTLEELEP